MQPQLEQLKNKCLQHFLSVHSVEDIAKDCPMQPGNDYGNLQEYLADGVLGIPLTAYIYGNRELLMYVGDIELPFTYAVDYYGDNPILVEY